MHIFLQPVTGLFNKTPAAKRWKQLLSTPNYTVNESIENAIEFIQKEYPKIMNVNIRK